MIAGLARGRIYYGWVIVLVSFLTMLVIAGIRSAPGALLLPLEAEFGWTRATTSMAVSINLFLFGLCGPFAAALMARVGMRAMMIGALLVLTAALLLASQLTALWQLILLWGLVVGLGTGAMAGWVAAAVASRWFVARRGLVVGLLTASNATGQLAFLPLLAAVIAAAGWRSAVLLAAAAALLLIPLVALFMRNSPEAIGLRPYGAPDEAPAGGSAAGPGGYSVPAAAPAPIRGNPVQVALTTLARCLRSRDFLLLAGSFFICGATTNGLIGTHMIPASHDHGIPEVTAARLLALIGIFDLIGTLGSGWLSDRYNSRSLLFWYYGLRGLSLLFLPFAYGTGLWGLGLFIVFYGLDWVATVPPTVRLTADLFGRSNVSTVYAWIMASHQLGAATAAFSAGALRTWLGDYQASFILAGGLALLAALMVRRIGRADLSPLLAGAEIPAPAQLPG